MFEIKQQARQAVHFVESRQSRDVEPWQSEDSHRRMKENQPGKPSGRKDSARASTKGEVTSGMLPGVRKSTLKKQLATEVGAVDDSGQKGRPGSPQCGDGRAGKEHE